MSLIPSTYRMSAINLILKRTLTTQSNSNSRKPPTLLSLADLSPSQISSILESSSSLKSTCKSSSLSLPSSSRVIPKHNGNKSALEQSLLNQTIAILFNKRSTRTRVASESSIAALGGNALFLSPSDIQLGVNESLYDTARVVSSMVDGIMARVAGHEEIEVLAQNSTVPVINALSSRYHPTQILADLLTIQEHYPSRPLSTFKVAWVGDSNNILNDMLVSMPRLGMDLSIATPKGKEYERDEIVWGEMEDGLNQLSKDGSSDVRKGNVVWTNDPKEAVKDADIIVTDTWISMGDEATKEQRLRDFKGFQVTEELAKSGGAKPDWKFMHCLPRKGDEVDDEVFYGPRSIVFPEAENRKWTIMALFDRMFGRFTLD